MRELVTLLRADTRNILIRRSPWRLTKQAQAEGGGIGVGGGGLNTHSVNKTAQSTLPFQPINNENGGHSSSPELEERTSGFIQMSHVGWANLSLI